MINANEFQNDYFINGEHFRKHQHDRFIKAPINLVLMCIISMD